MLKVGRPCAAGLLEKTGEKPPYILVGHSMGGPYSRIFRDLYPNEVAGIVFIDSSHPEQWKRLALTEDYFWEDRIKLKGELRALRIL